MDLIGSGHRMKRTIFTVLFAAVLALPLRPGEPGTRSLLFEGRVTGRMAAAEAEPARGLQFFADIRTVDIFALSSLLTEPEIYHDLVPTSASLLPKRPVIEYVTAHGNAGPRGWAISGGLTQITGRDLEETARVFVDGRAFPPLVLGPNSVVARLDGRGPSDLWLVTSKGVVSRRAHICLLQITAERELPPLLLPGRLYSALLRIDGTSARVSLTAETGSPAVSFDGTKRICLSSSGGGRNIIRFPVRAEQEGRYRITCRLDDVPTPAEKIGDTHPFPRNDWFRR